MASNDMTRASSDIACASIFLPARELHLTRCDPRRPLSRGGVILAYRGGEMDVVVIAAYVTS
jgi:hypothetical protein